MKTVIYILVLILPISAISQDWEAEMIELKSNKELYTVFNKFYNDSIRQETKDEWGKPYYNKIDMVYGLNYFDYNNDKLEDVLIEFSLYPSDGGTFYFTTAVLFENRNGKYVYVAHLFPEDLHFKYYKNGIYNFSGKGDLRFNDGTVYTNNYQLNKSEFKKI